MMIDTYGRRRTKHGGWFYLTAPSYTDVVFDHGGLPFKWVTQKCVAVEGKEEMKFADFKKKMRNLEPGREFVYHVGHLSRDRATDTDTNKIAAFALALDELGHGAIFQRRVGANFEYVVRVFSRLGNRVDGNGSFQECERTASLHAGRTETVRGYAPN